MVGLAAVDTIIGTSGSSFAGGGGMNMHGFGGGPVEIKLLFDLTAVGRAAGGGAAHKTARDIVDGGNGSRSSPNKWLRSVVLAHMSEEPKSTGHKRSGTQFGQIVLIQTHAPR